MAVVNDYHVNNRLLKYWTVNSLVNMKKKDSDRVYITDGHERGGKSLWTIQQACILEPGLLESPEKLVSRICFTAEEFRDVVRNTKNGVVIFDEAFRGLASRATMSRTNKMLIQILMEMGQNNNIVFIVLPSFFMLDIYPAMLRSNCLFNIYEDKRSRKRCWRFYNKADKNKLYQWGVKRGWSYLIKSKVSGNFYNKFPGGDAFREAYLKKKAASLAGMFEKEEKSNEEPREVKLIRHLKEEYKYSNQKIADILGCNKGRISEMLNSGRSNNTIILPKEGEEIKIDAKTQEIGLNSSNFEEELVENHQSPI